jgi:hypothetical protein
MAEHDNHFHATAQLLDSILQAAKHLASETVASNPNDEQVIGTLVEDEFDRNPCVGASENRSEWSVFRTFRAALRQSDILRVDLDDPPCDAIMVRQTVQQTGECLIALI